jgi:Coenzyme PQQ synthesis protein D (PqqD)
MKLRVDDITWREIDGDLVVLDLRSSTYLTTNASATVLMKQLTQDRTLAQLVRALVDAFAIPDQRAQEDVLAFLDELGERGLLDSSDRERRRDPVAASGGR